MPSNGSPAPLLKFQIAPRLRLLMSSESKKKKKKAKISLSLKVPGKWTPSRFPTWAPMERVAFFQSLLLHVSWIPPKARSPDKIPPFSQSPGNGASLPRSPTEPLWRKMPLSRALLYISIKVPSKGASPPGSSQSSHRERERDALFLETSFECLFKVPSKWSPLQVPHWGPYGERCLFPEPSCTYPSGYPVKEPSLQVLLTELP